MKQRLRDPVTWVIVAAVVFVVVVIVVVSVVPTARPTQWKWRARAGPLPLKPHDSLKNDALGAQFGASLRFSPDNTMLYVASPTFYTQNGQGYLYAMPSGDLRGVLQRDSEGDHFGAVACFSRDTVQVVSTSRHKVWRMLVSAAPLTKEVIVPPTLDQGEVPYALDFTPDDGQLIYSLDAATEPGGTAKGRAVVTAVFSDKTSQPRQTIPHAMAGLRVTRDNVLWGVDTHSDLMTSYVQVNGYWEQVPHNVPASVFAVSNDGSYLITYTKPGHSTHAASLVTYEMKYGQVVKVLQTFNNYPNVNSLATTESGQFVALVRSPTAASSTAYLFQVSDHMLGTSQIITSSEASSSVPLNVAMTTNETGTMVIAVGDPSFFENRGQVEWWTANLSKK